MSSYRTSTLNVRSEQFFIFVSGFYFRETHWKWLPRLWISFPDIDRSMKSYFNSTWFPFADIKIRFKLGVQSALKLLIWNSINPLKPKISLIYCPKPHFLGFPSRTVCTYAALNTYVEINWLKWMVDVRTMIDDWIDGFTCNTAIRWKLPLHNKLLLYCIDMYLYIQ